jgi:hypothetical protein
VETKVHLCFLKKVGGRCGCVYGTKGAVDRKSLETTGLDVSYSPGMKYAILSRILLSNSCGQPLVSGTCWVKHNKGPKAHSSESSSTDKLPDTAIWPYKLRRHIYKGNTTGPGGLMYIYICRCHWMEKIKSIGFYQGRTKRHTSQAPAQGANL